jgi:hypothetical protein
MATIYTVLHFAFGYGKFFASFVEMHDTFDEIGSVRGIHIGGGVETKSTGVYNSKYKYTPHANIALDISQPIDQYDKIVGVFEPHSVQDFYPEYIENVPNDIRIIALIFDPDSYTIARSIKYAKGAKEWWDANSPENISLKWKTDARDYFKINMDRLLALDENEYTKLCNYCDMPKLPNWKSVITKYLEVSE